MPFTIPDKGEGDNDIQSILFQEYLEVLAAGIQGIDCVVFGCAITGGADMTPAVAKGSVLSNGTLFNIAAADVTVTAADGTHPRIDLIVVTSAGSLAVRAGTPAAAPKPPARTANDVVLAAVYVPAGDTTIATSQITDMRVIRDRNVVVHKVTSAVVFNTTAVAQDYMVITLGNGLFTAGRQLRVTCGGSYLMNNGSPTVTPSWQSGAVNFFNDVSGAFTADADRGAWHADMIINASADNAQQMSGFISFQTPGAKTAPSGGSGQGDMSVTTHVTTPIHGTSAHDNTASNYVIKIRFVMSVSHVNNEISLDYGTAVLL